MYKITTALIALIAQTHAGCCRTVCAQSYFMSQGECVPVAAVAPPARESNIPCKIAQEASCLGFDARLAVSFVSLQDGILGFVGGDIDNDGIGDYVTTSYSERKLRVHYARGTEEIVVLPFHANSWAQFLALCDVDRDGDLDLLADAHRVLTKGKSYVYINDGKGNFADPQLIGPKGRVTMCGASAGELVQITDDASYIIRLRESSTPKVSLTLPVTIRHPIGAGVRADVNFYALDLDSDGTDELLHLSQDFFYDADTFKVTEWESLVVQYSTGDVVSLIESRESYNPEDLRLSITSIHAVDMDADGDPDIVVALRKPLGGVLHNTLLILENLGNGTWPTAFNYSAPHIEDNDVYSSWACEVGDFDGDGDNDILVFDGRSKASPYTIFGTLFEARGHEFAKSAPLSFEGSWGKPYNPLHTGVIKDGAQDVVAFHSRFNGGIYELEAHELGCAI